jgi:wyosine [tRNA(Phe)-imidazoG37] synthetase (radical SAM superfamily)
MPSREQHSPAYIFGPVFSRRIGLSLGIDLVPFKTCTFDCIYCQLGHTSLKTGIRQEYVPVNAVLSQLNEALKKVPRPDFITLSGSGEPTLHSRLGDIIHGIRRITSLPVAVLTNGSLLYDSEVRRDCALADLVLPSLDACDEETFQKVNRPVSGMTFHGLIDGLRAFWREYTGKIWLEVFLVHPLTDSDHSVRKIALLTRSFRPDWIHLLTVCRPPSESSVQAVSPARLECFSRFFEPRAQCVFSTTSLRTGPEPALKDLQNILKRRPCTLEDLTGILNIPPIEIFKNVNRLMSEGHVVNIRHNKNLYYKAEP